MAERKVALVTGANRGIGLEIAKQLARQGLTVVAATRSPHALKPMAEALKAYGDIRTLVLDVDVSASVEAAERELAARGLAVDVLVNNAGIAPEQFVPGLEARLDKVEACMNTNFYGPLRCCQVFMPGMIERGYGRVVNVSSELASMGAMELPGTIGYRSSKAALNALTKLLSLEVQDHPDIKINAACPGWVRTELGGPDAIYSVEEGADTPAWLATLASDGPSGGLFRQREPYPW